MCWTRICPCRLLGVHRVPKTAHCRFCRAAGMLTGDEQFKTLSAQHCSLQSRALAHSAQTRLHMHQAPLTAGRLTACADAVQVLHAAGVSGLSQQDLFTSAKRLTASRYTQEELIQGLHRVRLLLQPVCLVMLCLQRLVCCHAKIVLSCQTRSMTNKHPAGIVPSRQWF